MRARVSGLLGRLGVGHLGLGHLGLGHLGLRHLGLWPLRRDLAFGVVGLFTFAVVVAGYSLSLGQVFLVEARTLGASVALQGHGNAWRLPPLTFCEPRPMPVPGESASGGVCAADMFLEHRLAEAVEVVLPEGMRVVVTAGADGGLTLRAEEAPAPAALSEGLSWGRGGVIVIAAEDWQHAGILYFEGRVVIGSDVGSGEEGYLVEGRYQIRERLLRQWFSAGEAPVEVASGELLRGDRVEFRGRLGAEGVLARGFIAPSASPDEAGFLMTVASSPDLCGADFVVESFGAREVLVRPSWTDRATRDPVLVALGAVVALVSALVGLALQAAGKRED